MPKRQVSFIIINHHQHRHPGISVPTESAASPHLGPPQARRLADVAPSIVVDTAIAAATAAAAAPGVAGLAPVDVAGAADAAVPHGGVLLGGQAADLVVQREDGALVGPVGVARAADAGEEAEGAGGGCWRCCAR